MDVIRNCINGIDIYQVIEMDIGIEVHWTFEHVATTEEVRKIPWLFPTYVAEDGSFQAIVQSFVVAIGNRVVVIDTCIGNEKDRMIELPRWSHLQTNFMESFRKTGFAPEDVTDVLCTHMHMDHVGWNTSLRDGNWVPTFPNAKHYFSRTEYEYWLGNPDGAGEGNHLAFADSVQPVIDAGMAVFVDDNADLGDGISLLPTPGHTPGHVSIRLRTEQGALYITGDSIHHPCQLARTEWSARIDWDQEVSRQSRRKLLDLASCDNAYLAGSHFSIPSIGRVVPAEDGRDFAFVGIGAAMPNAVAPTQENPPRGHQACGGEGRRKG
ncbi:MBL fold metallo-hydrolase [Paracoccus versutus]|uniref:Glyoxylase-like metal-dependent hydrolase (Beta-lactamase superfamily II) n=1 Tax=Paracoccus versutus TaxID=34007 RepID=A0A3D9XW41_PARVE|nr:MBL fold metallo-hydrolase [Paracoccus versutus]REF73343.1 glyoxylase-like metal-dependent hydrolase (beta-lactamase superfamily II) [Paracoccus versutus]WGR54634.1 MBL fold metallo-hydrolase [Paracoccus versutus]